MPEITFTAGAVSAPADLVTRCRSARPTRRTPVPVIGSAIPIVTANLAGSRTWDVQVICLTETAARTVENLLAGTAPVTVTCAGRTINGATVTAIGDVVVDLAAGQLGIRSPWTVDTVLQAIA